MPRPSGGVCSVLSVGRRFSHRKISVRETGAAGLALQESTGKVAAAHPEWPRFRVGINSGPVSVSLLGTTGGRVQAIVGDMVNTASRIEGEAPAGGVAIGEQTRRLIPGAETVW